MFTNVDVFDGVNKKLIQNANVVVTGNPLENIELVANPGENFDLIMKDGKIFKNEIE